jgi:hypothetical protein
MNRWFTSVFLIILFFVVVAANAQPDLSYIIPDIGAPGMNVYVEFIAPYNKKGTFGSNGFYENNSIDAVRVEPLIATDKSKIKVGPVIVSWDGRLISTQIFILPTLQPNSTDALLLRPEFRIPLVVIVNGVPSNKQIFYIVKPRPYFDGTKNTSELVFGAGALGTRSPRGAMIFDSLSLTGSTYTVSTADCDPDIEGNQGFLPFTLLAKGKIEGTTNSTISVDGIRKNGGPGGGGGGGRFYDAFLTGLGEIGDDGGSGFVGGGAGGRNRNGFGISDAFKKQGSGTGNSGNSLNLVPFPANAAFESAAGGTGHPFGTSGTSCIDGNNCNPTGGYGAGSGRPQNTQGGAAGYSTSGVGPSAGGVVGNIMNVPVAGGSGGASGNPNFPGAYSGNGGGGGGAITLFGSVIKNINVKANGAPGDNPSGGVNNNSYGGSGSGGMINLMSKSTIENVKAEVSGASNNGRSSGSGRYRFDGDFTSGLPAMLTSGAPFYTGIRTDTTQFVEKEYKVNWNQALPGKNITSYLYYAPFGKDWIKTGITRTDPIGTYFFYQRLDSTEKYHCFVFIQNVPGNNQSEFENEPSAVMSQAAANLLILELNPILVADTIAENMAITCIGFERTIETVIKNDPSAGGNLKFNLSNSNWILGNNGFEIVSPLGNIDIKPGDSIVLKVKYQYTGGSKTNISNRLFFNHNDPSKNTPWIIEFKVGDAYLPGMVLEGNFDYPDTRINGKSTRSFQLKNVGEAPLLIETINPINPPFYVVGTNPLLPVILKVGESLSIQVEFRPTAVQEYNSSLSAISIVTDTTCSSFAFQNLKGKGILSPIEVNRTEIDFGLIAWCDEKQEIISIQNPSSASASFTLTTQAVIVGDNPEAFIITNPKNPPITITPGDGTQFNIKINGKSAGNGVKKAVFRIETDVPETPVIEVTLLAEISGFQVIPNQSPLNFGNVDIGFEKQSTFSLRNLGKFEERIKSITSNNPASFSNFTVTDYTIDPLIGISNISFTFNSKLQPLNNQLIIAFDNPCNDTIIIPINLNYVIAKESARDKNNVKSFFSDSTKIDTLDFGKLSPCDIAAHQAIVYTNLSQGRYRILNEEVINFGDAAFFSVGSALLNDTIKPLDISNALQIDFDPTGLKKGVYIGEYRATIYINGQEVKRRIILKGEIIEGDYDITPSNYNFSSVVGLFEEFEFTITNKGPFQLDIVLINNPEFPIFEVSPNLVGNIIEVSKDGKFKIKFTPNSVTSYKDSIVFTIKTGGCNKTFTVYLNGNGLPSKKLKVYIPNLVVEPTLNNYKIPIYGKLDKRDDDLSGFTIDSLKITMHRSMFYPDKIIGGTVIKSTLVGDDRVMNIKLENITISDKDSIIAEIEGSTLLGDTNFTNITISDLFYSMKVLVGEVTTENGSMKTEICSEGGDRLLKMQGSGNKVAVNPNPAGDVINLIVNPIEKGNYKITLIDVIGKEIEIISWENNINSTYETKTIIFDTSHLNVGTYIVKMITPSELITSQFVIIK